MLLLCLNETQQHSALTILLKRSLSHCYAHSVLLDSLHLLSFVCMHGVHAMLWYVIEQRAAARRRNNQSHVQSLALRTPAHVDSVSDVY
jgi:hypothetical protein